MDPALRNRIARAVSECQYAEAKEYDLQTREVRPIEYAYDTRDEMESVLPLVRGDEDVEELAKRLYERAGYRVLRLESTEAIERAANGHVSEIILNFLSDLVSQSEDHIEGDLNRLQGLSEILTTGVPDLLVYDVKPSGRIGDMFFSEVKSQTDSLRMSQLDWIFNHSYLDCRVLHVAVKDYDISVQEEEKEGEIGSSKPDEVVYESIHAAEGHELKREEIKKAKEAVSRRKENGYYQGGIPTGLKFDEDKQYLIPDDDFPTVLEVLRLRDEGHTLQQIKDETQIGSISTVSRILNRRQMYEEKAEVAEDQ